MEIRFHAKEGQALLKLTFLYVWFICPSHSSNDCFRDNLDHEFMLIQVQVINKTDIAAAVGADLGIMERDALRMRDGGPFVFAQVVN